MYPQTNTISLLHTGASEMLMANAVHDLSARTPGKESMAIESFARALRQLPTIIADNAGYDSSELISQLRAMHSEGKTTMGLGEREGERERERESGGHKFH
jgi:T-complex protein 1 subunit beta